MAEISKKKGPIPKQLEREKWRTKHTRSTGIFLGDARTGTNYKHFFFSFF